jgi:argininosuccinate lyase
MSLSPTSFKTSQAQITISYKLFSDKKKVLRVKKEIVQPGLPFVNAHLQVTAKAVRHKDEKGGYVLSISIEALQDMELVSFEATYIADLKDQRMMANGFQSWSQAREFTKNDKIPAIRSGIAWYTQLNLQG